MRHLFLCACLLTLHGVGAYAQPKEKDKELKDIFQANTVLDIKLTLKEAQWDKMLDTYKQSGSDDRLVGDVTINGVAYKQVGVRYKGNSSYFRVRDLDEKKLPFNIKVNEVTKGQKLPGGITTLKLANAFLDPSFVREVLAYEIAGKYMPSPRANFAKVYVNGQYLGLYNCTESIDELFTEKHFGTQKGALVKCDPNWHVKAKANCKSSDNASLAYVGEDSVCYMGVYELQDGARWKDVIRLARVLEKEPQKLESTLNVDQTLWMLAFNNVLVNLDSYTGQLCHNYYLYLDTLGMYHTLVWDMNLCFGGFRLTGSGPSLSEAGMQTMSPLLHFKEGSGPSVQRPLITKLLSNDLYQKIYIAHIRTILEENFSNGLYLTRAKEIQKLVDKQVKDDVNKLYDYALFQKNIDTTVVVDEKRIIGIKELMAKRTEYLLSHPLLQRTPPGISDVKHVVEGEKINITATVTDGTPVKVWLCYRYSDSGPFQATPMSGETTAYLAAIDNKAGAQYYVIAENAQAATLSPARAAKEFYQVK